jgi:hypothetical protein
MVLVLGFLSSTLLQCFAVNIGAAAIPLIVPITYVLLLALFMNGVTRVGTVAFGFLALQAVVVLLSLGLSDRPDPNSALFLIGIYGIWIFEFRQVGSLQAIHRVQGLHLAFALLGLLQFGVQFLGVGFMSLYAVLPHGMLQPGFSYINALSYGSHYCRANGVFFLEPSYFSRQMALALLIEIHLFRRGWFMLMFTCALLVTVSGTGLIMLATGLLFLGNRRLRAATVAGLLVLLMSALAIAVIPQARSIAAKRLLEFSDPNKSGYVRFVAPYLADYYLITHRGLPIIGQGPGTSERATIGIFNFSQAEVGGSTGTTAAYDVTYAKLLYEYGVVGLGLFLVWSFRTYGRGVPRFLSSSQLVSYWLLAGALLVAPQVMGTYWMLGFFPRTGSGESR